MGVWRSVFFSAAPGSRSRAQRHRGHPVFSSNVFSVSREFLRTARVVGPVRDRKHGFTNRSDADSLTDLSEPFTAVAAMSSPGGPEIREAALRYLVDLIEDHVRF